MQNLSTLLRNLADIIDANGGEVPEILLKPQLSQAPEKRTRKINNRQAIINQRVHEVLFTSQKKKQ